MAEMLTMTGQMAQMKATVLALLGVRPPTILPPPIEIPPSYTAERIVLAIFDNFGLFECSYYKPEFLVKIFEAILLLETEKPYAEDVTRSLVYGEEDSGFNLFNHLADHSIRTMIIERGEDIYTPMHHMEDIKVKRTTDDMNTYIEAVKNLNRFDLLWLHFLDFEMLYSQFSNRPPKEIAQRLILRTDKWIKMLYLQLLPESLLIVLGNHGSKDAEVAYSGRLAQMRNASLPIALLSKKV